MMSPEEMRKTQLALVEQYDKIDSKLFEGPVDPLASRVYCAFSAHMTTLFFHAHTLGIPVDNLLQACKEGYEHFLARTKIIEEEYHEPGTEPAGTNPAGSENVPNG